MSSNLFTPSLRYTNKDTCNSAWTFIDGQNISDIEVPKFIKNLFTSFDDSRYGKMGKDLIEGFACTRPTDPGYEFGSVQENSLDSHSFNVNNLQCATGYGGTASASVCPSNGQPYTVSGCGRKTCADPEGTSTSTAYECSGDGNHLKETPESVNCSGDRCTDTDCCTGEQQDGSGSGVGGGVGSDHCLSVQCGANATCTALESSYTCTCNDGFYGAATPGGAASCTEMTCADIDGSSTVAGCGPNASCNNGGSNDGYTCSCSHGSTGTDVQNGPTTDCPADAAANGDGNITCTKPSTIPAHVNPATLPNTAIFSSSTGELISGQNINASCAAGYSVSPNLSCNTAGPYGITGCDTEDQTTHKCSSAFEGATTGKDQPCNLNAPDSAGWTKGNFGEDPLWAKYDTGKDNSSLNKDESDAIKAFITANTGTDLSYTPAQMNNEVWNKCCTKAECTDEGWANISITDTDGSWYAYGSSWECTFTS